MADDKKAEEGSGSGGYLSSATSYLPSFSGTKDAAADAPGQAQKGAGAAGGALKDVTSPVPVVGSVVEGVGNAPIAQKIGGKEEEKGYLGSAYEYAGGAARKVYDAAGNVIGTVEHKAGEYWSTKGKDGEKVEGTENESTLKDATETAKKTDGDQEDSTEAKAASKAEESTQKTGESAQSSAGKAQETYNKTTEGIKQGHRDIEDTAQSGVKDGVSHLQDATGTKEATSGASEGLDHTADAAKGTARGVEDSAQKTVGGVGGGASDMAKGATGDDKVKDVSESAKGVGGSLAGGVKDVGGGAVEGGKGAAGGVAETGKGVAGGVGAGAQSVGSGLGSVTGLGGK